MSRVPPVADAVGAELGLNARLMDIVTTSSLQTLDFRSQHSADRVANELYLKDKVLSAAPAATLPRAQEAALQQRIASLLAEISRLFSDGGKVKLERWLPTDGGDPAADLAAAAGDASPLHLEASTPTSTRGAAGGRRRRRRAAEEEPAQARRRRRHRPRCARSSGTTRTTRSLLRRRGTSTPPRARATSRRNRATSAAT